MDLAGLAAFAFSLFMGVVVLFQIALAAGAPWGQLAMGGKYPGRFPPYMRVAALVQAALLTFASIIVLIRANVLLPNWYPIAETGTWVVVSILGLSLIMNLATPSRWERIIWAPVAAILVTSSLIVANS